MKAAIVGGGVIGGGWAARFVLNGWDVAVCDPDPEVKRKVEVVLDNARRSLPQLSDIAMPAEGTLRYVDTIAEAVSGAHWVQESVPERLEVKHSVYREIQQHAPEHAVVGSSTSGYKPSQLREGAHRPGNILVAHPFNPVYLLPLIELVPGDAADESVTRRAQQILTEIGMKPLLVRTEIDAHIADRFLEAVWREGLWLINDGIATTEEIDDAIRYGFGLRWAQMGLFETYRIAGGEAGMAHFIAQFGPCLSWPWTKLMDVPELTEELVEKIALQSDEQSGMHTIRDLERIRDDNLVGMMRALKDHNWGAGALLREHDERMAQKIAVNDEHVVSKGIDLNKPLELFRGQVLASWIDYNGHMTEARYLDVCTRISDAFLLMIGVDADYVKRGYSYYTVETHILHIDEAKLGEPLRGTCQVITSDNKRLHAFHTIYAGDGRVLASAEQMFLHVDANAAKACDADSAVLAKLRPIADAHACLEPPAASGRYVGKPRHSN